MHNIEIFSHSNGFADFVPGADRTGVCTLFFTRGDRIGQTWYWDGDDWTSQSVYAQPYNTIQEAKKALACAAAK